MVRKTRGLCEEEVLECLGNIEERGVLRLVHGINTVISKTYPVKTAYEIVGIKESDNGFYSRAVENYNELAVRMGSPIIPIRRQKIVVPEQELRKQVPVYKKPKEPLEDCIKQAKKAKVDDVFIWTMKKLREKTALSTVTALYRNYQGKENRKTRERIGSVLSAITRGILVERKDSKLIKVCEYASRMGNPDTIEDTLSKAEREFDIVYD